MIRPIRPIVNDTLIVPISIRLKYCYAIRSNLIEFNRIDTIAR